MDDHGDVSDMTPTDGILHERLVLGQNGRDSSVDGRMMERGSTTLIGSTMYLFLQQPQAGAGATGRHFMNTGPAGVLSNPSASRLKTVGSDLQWSPHEK